ncbi:MULTISPECIES: sensor histidine kinase [Kocuria]|uniref:sensor histidine kinase n=1 Tax=Kocuria TaxID=57493 RepID=UPI00119CF97D|nr:MULTISPECIES: ATP-binding protein [Kocuria]MBO4145861.1 GHKL domain-containing protein [Kocuria rhizophila]MDA4828810.1 ATP-binding protein [Kocuria rhizophila]MDN3462282.1 ATP-binding protein [Kocuria sp. APC 4018]WSQ05421.1 ATP-binding protein [Kocuria rhizophila]
MSLAQRFLALQLALVVVITLVVAVVMVGQTRTRVTDRAESVTRVATTTLADDPFVRSSLLSADPHARLQPVASAVERDTDVDFVTVMTPEGTRITHYDPSRVGQQYLGDRTHALAGETYTATEVGRLGPSVRTIAPVRDADGTVIGLVSSGVLLDRIATENRRELPGLLLISGSLLAMSSLISLLMARYLHRVTGGRSPESLVRQLALNRAVLSEAREGLVLLDRDDRPVLANARAAQLLGVDLPEDHGTTAAGDRTGFVDTDSAAAGPSRSAGVDRGAGTPEPRGRRRRSPRLRRRVPVRATRGEGRRSPVSVPRPVAGLLAEETTFTDRRCTVAGRTLVATCTRASGDETLRVLMVQDQTELSRMAGELDLVRTMAAGLRAQTHEHANRLHTVVSLLELERYPQALEFASATAQLSVRVGDTVTRHVRDPFLAALLMGKAATARERGVEFAVLTHGEIPVLAVEPSDLVSVVGNLVDNAVDAAAGVHHPGAVDGSGGETPSVEVELTTSGDGRCVHVTVSDNGPGVPQDARERIFEHGVTSKHETGVSNGVGLHVARGIVSSWGTSIRVECDAGAVFTVDVPALHPAVAAEVSR